jgi:hypothetical protein
MLRTIASGVIGFARFWYRFIVGDDWTIAVAVIVGLALTALLTDHRVTSWWLVPVIVIVSVASSLVRKSRTRARVRGATRGWGRS